jgi:hypothetical protein
MDGGRTSLGSQSRKQLKGEKEERKECIHRDRTFREMK